MSLGAPVGEEDGVGPTGRVAVALLVVAKVGAAVLVVHAVLEGVVRRLRLLLVVTRLRHSSRQFWIMPQ